MKLFSTLPLLILLSCSTKNSIERKVTIKPIGWQFPLTTETIFIDSAFNSTGEVIAEIPGDGPSLKLFTIKDSLFGSFRAFLRKDTLQYKDWKIWHDKDTKWFFEQIEKLPQIQLLEKDYYVTTIDSAPFLVQYNKYVKESSADTFYLYNYFGRINDIELNINFEYNKESIGKKYMNIINRSKFVD